MKDYTGIKWVEEHQRWQSSVRQGGDTLYVVHVLNQKKMQLWLDTKKIMRKNLPVKLQMLKPVKL
jgi:hypothetical protein